MSKLVTVFSPAGEPFEVTPVNARDLTKHAGFTYEAPNGTAPAPAAEAKADADAEAKAAAEREAAEQEAALVAKKEEIEARLAAEAKAAAEAQTAAETPAVRLTEEDFADLEDKAAVRAYIEATFPDAEIDGRSNREKLIALAIELATAE